jgi:uroporphyrinogen-III synthase
VKRVLVLRAREDALRTAEKLRDMGFAPLLSPVLETAATGAAQPRGDFDAAVATSARGVALAGFALALPLHAVGARTAALGWQRGWGGGLVAESAADLAQEICARYAEPLRLLYLAGHDRKDALEASLRRGGHEVVAVEIYEARAAQALTEEALQGIAGGRIAAALHYSRRSARIFAGLVEKAGLCEDLRQIPQFALSHDVGEALGRDLALEPRIAPAPNEDSLLALLAANIE